jgi:hypothetical protein
MCSSRVYRFRSFHLNRCVWQRESLALAGSRAVFNSLQIKIQYPSLNFLSWMTDSSVGKNKARHRNIIHRSFKIIMTLQYDHV